MREPLMAGGSEQTREASQRLWNHGRWPRQWQVCVVSMTVAGIEPGRIGEPWRCFKEASSFLSFFICCFGASGSWLVAVYLFSEQQFDWIFMYCLNTWLIVWMCLWNDCFSSSAASVRFKKIRKERKDTAINSMLAQLSMKIELALCFLITSNANMGWGLSKPQCALNPLTSTG